MSAFDVAETKFLSYLKKEGMLSFLAGGALLALSGGKDSSLLLHLLARLAKKEGFPLFALHLHHGIRGAEADRDADFCATLCARLAVPLISCASDVPALARECGEGLEETARKERYRLLAEAAREKGLGAVFTAHNATDNLETLLLHLTRGGGGNAMCGIPPVRPLFHNEKSPVLLRPLLCLTAEEILDAVNAATIPFVCDSTNADSAYRRNLIRNEVLPRLRGCNPSVEKSALRLAENLREDMRMLDAMAERAYDEARVPGGLSASALLAMERPVAYRALRLLLSDSFGDAPLPERVHVDALLVALAETGDFSISFPGDLLCVREGDVLFFQGKGAFALSRQKLHIGENVLSDGGRLYVMEKGFSQPNENIYTLSIQLSLASATIENELYVRSKADGDAYRTGGMTRRLKKLFSDAAIPPRLRSHLPVVCDGEGILWVPSFGLRDGASGDSARLFYAPPTALLEEMRPVLSPRTPKKNASRKETLK